MKYPTSEERTPVADGGAETNRPAKLRRAELKDLCAIRACALDAYTKYVGRIGKEPAPMVADFEALVQRRVVFVAVDKDEAVMGFIVFYPRGDHLHLENVAVLTAHQGKGVGKALIGFCETEARNCGHGAVELYTNAKMTENLRLYPRLGYAEVDRREEDGFNRVYFRKPI